METDFEAFANTRADQGASTLTASIIDKLALAYLPVAFFSLSLHGVPKQLWAPIVTRALGELGFVGDLSVHSIGFLYVGRRADKAGGLAVLERTIIERISAEIRENFPLLGSWQLDVAAAQCRSCDLHDMQNLAPGLSVRHYTMGGEEEECARLSA